MCILKCWDLGTVWELARGQGLVLPCRPAAGDRGHGVRGGTYFNGCWLKHRHLYMHTQAPCPSPGSSPDPSIPWSWDHALHLRLHPRIRDLHHTWVAPGAAPAQAGHACRGIREPMRGSLPPAVRPACAGPVWVAAPLSQDSRQPRVFFFSPPLPPAAPPATGCLGCHGLRPQLLALLTSPCT